MPFVTLVTFFTLLAYELHIESFDVTDGYIVEVNGLLNYNSVLCVDDVIRVVLYPLRVCDCFHQNSFNCLSVSIRISGASGSSGSA